METKRNIQIDFVTAKELYKQGGNLRKIVLQVFTENELQELPKSWEEYCKINPYLDANKEVLLFEDNYINPPSYMYCERKKFPLAMPSQKRAEQFIILSKLLQIRDYYNQDWMPDWANSDEHKYIISTHRNKLNTFTSLFTNYIFAFKTKKLRDKFLTNFKKDLEFIKEFL